jgi:predicted regulator of Ras-like GTPase activity (Roadblock/LC7/MglB family)
MTSDQSLRENRLVLYRHHMELVERVLVEFLRKSGARCALLIDKDGHLVTSAGDEAGVDPDTISALVAGAFAATKEMAKLLGEQEFSALFHQGTHDSIQLSLVGGRSILTVLFDDSTTLGMVRLYVSEAVRRLAEIMERPASDKDKADDDIDPSYTDSASRTLDDLFG